MFDKDLFEISKCHFKSLEKNIMLPTKVLTTNYLVSKFGKKILVVN